MMMIDAAAAADDDKSLIFTHPLDWTTSFPAGLGDCSILTFPFLLSTGTSHL